MRHPLPYAFARSSQLLLEDDGQQLVLWHGPAPDVTALSEVLRKHKVRHLLSLDATSLAQRISAAYAQGESSAATVVSEVESDADLSRMMQDLPAVEDLLETADDAPIIRMLNALLTQAGGSKERRPMTQFGLTHLCFRVDDVEAVAAAVVEHGGTVHENTRTTLADGVLDFVYCSDPDGVRLELMKTPS